MNVYDSLLRGGGVFSNEALLDFLRSGKDYQEPAYIAWQNELLDNVCELVGYMHSYAYNPTHEDYEEVLRLSETLQQKLVFSKLLDVCDSARDAIITAQLEIERMIKTDYPDIGIEMVLYIY